MTEFNKGATGLAALAACGLVLAGCSSSSDTAPSTSPSISPSVSPTETSPAPTPTPTHSTASPSASAYGTNGKLKSGTAAIITGGSAYAATSGVVNVKESSGTKSIAVAGKSKGSTGDWILDIKVDSSGVVTSGTLTSPNSEYKVYAKSGKLNFLSTSNQTTIVTTTPIKVQRGTQTPTTMNLSVSYTF